MILSLLPLFVLIPIVTFLICFFIPRTWEKILSNVAITGIFSVFALFVAYCVYWGQNGFGQFAQTGLTLFSSSQYTFSIDFFFDLTSVVFFAMTCLTTILIFVFSKYYMHRDPGFKRFYTTVLFFFVGLSLIIFSGNFETLFVGWEFIGISSFLLIAFYRDRFLPTKNGLKIFSLYRIADAFLLVAIWYAHHLFETNIHFSQFSSIIAEHGNTLALFGTFMLIVALIKSAQFPFSYWLPRAMEGPTTSSAIFYGALSVHMGLFLLLRTFPLWEGSLMLRIVIIVLGLITALVATSITRVQSSIKTQIAYASITQIGIMFVELALGLHWLVLLHFVSNACLRTYQLLISPSILSYLVHYQFYFFVLPAQKIKNNFIGKLRASFYILGIKEWNMDTAMSRFIWQPLKHIGQTFSFMDRKWAYWDFAILIIIAGYLAYGYGLSESARFSLAVASGIVSLLWYIRAYTMKGSAKDCWNEIFLGQLYGGLFLTVISGGTLQTILLYGAGIPVAFLIGYFCLKSLEKKGDKNELIDFHGQMYKNGVLGNIFFLAALCMMVFPITPSFLGEEMLLSLIHTDQVLPMIIFSIGYVLSGICILRLFAKVFFGPHKKTYHEIAYRTS